MKKTNWGLIGCGKVVLKNKKTPFLNKKNNIKAICTTDIEHSRNACKKLNIKHCGCYENVYNMLKHESLDAIYICTPPKYHFDYLNILSNYSIPIIYVEKPFVLNKQQASIILKQFKNSKTQVYIANYKRLTNQVIILKRLLNSKIYGKIISVDGYFDRIFDKKLLDNSWIYNKDISGGGRFFDIAPHILDTLYYLLGPFKYIKSNVLYKQKEHNCESSVTTTFKIDDIKCSLYFNLNSKKDRDLIYIKCQKAHIVTSINRKIPILIFDLKNNLIKKIKFRNNKIWGMEAIDTIHDIINKKNTNPITSLQDAYIIQSYIEEILTSTNEL